MLRGNYEKRTQNYPPVDQSPRGMVWAAGGNFLSVDCDKRNGKWIHTRS